MTKLAIQASNISKQYILGSSHRRKDSLREGIANALSAPIKGAIRSVRRLPKPTSPKDNIFWALKDVNFEIHQGDTVGIIGRNGAGKSTLLKILSRITEPSVGTIDLYGRVGALLEVGTGFHTELTGRENIFLNGAILGMTRAEIARKYDEMVDFSGMEKFIDTPVKRYSSGMALRLGFAVAAHLETEILIVDEVLAVGDAEFQRKCLGKMQNVAGEGRTVLFVSHNLNAVLNLCKRGIYLNHGQIVAMGSADEVVQTYTNMIDEDTVLGVADLTTHKGRNKAMTPIFRHIRLLNETGTPITDFKTGDTIMLEIGYDAGNASYDNVQVSVHSIFGERLCTVSSQFDPNAPQKLTGEGMITCVLPRLPLNEGDYSLTLSIGNKTVGDADMIESAMTFRVWFSDYFKTGASISSSLGYFIQESQWKLL